MERQHGLYQDCRLKKGLPRTFVSSWKAKQDMGLRYHLWLHSWVAVKEFKLRDYPPIMENQMEKKMENEMETGGI